MAQVTVPFSYVDQVRSPAAAILRGYEAGLQRQDAMRQAAIAEEDRRRKIAQEDRQLAASLAKEQQTQLFRGRLSNLANNPSPTIQDYVEVAQVAPPEMSKLLSDTWNAVSGREQQAMAKQMAETISVLKYGDDQTAANYFNERMQAAINAGDDQSAAEAKLYRDMVVAGESDIAVKQLLTQAMLVPGLGPQWVEAFGKLEPPKPKIVGTPTTWDAIGLVRTIREDGAVEFTQNGKPISPEEGTKLIVEELDRQVEEGLQAKANEAITLGDIEAMRVMGQNAIGAIDVTRNNLSELNKAVRQLETIINSGEYEMALENGVWGTLSRRALSLYDDNFKLLGSTGAGLALGLTGLISGPMSDRDIEILFRKAMPELSPGALMQEFKERIQIQERALGVLQNKAAQAVMNPSGYREYVAREYLRQGIDPSKPGAPRGLVITPEPEE